MSIVAPPSTLIYPVVDWNATGVTLGVRIRRVTDGVDVVARTTVGVVESPAASGIYVQAAGLTTPATAGTFYEVVWDNTSDFAIEDLTVSYSAVTVTAPTGTDLCTLANVKDYLQKTDSNFDTILQSLITRASAVIENYAMREFADKGTLTRTFQQDGSLVDLLPYDLRSVTTVTVDPVGAATVITSSQYALRPLSKTMLGTYIQLRTSAYTSLYSERRSSFGSSEISVTGSWGAATTPLPVVQACVVTVGLWFRREIAARGNAASDWDIDGVDLRPLSMPGAAQRLVDPYRRTVFA